VDGPALDADEVDGLVERLDDAGVARRQGVLDVVERRVNEDARVVPGGRLDADRLMDQAALLERLVGDRDGCAED
jgi:hypothetical protein